MAVSVTVDASYIYIDSSANTDDMDDVYTAVGSDAIFSRSGTPGAYVYTVLGNRIFYIRNTGTYVTLQAGCTLNFAYTTNHATGFYTNTATTFKAEEGTTINFDSLGNNILHRATFLGGIILAGTSGSHVTLSNISDFYLYNYRVGDDIQWTYVDANMSRYSIAANILFPYEGETYDWSNCYWRYVTWDGDPTSSGTRYGRINFQTEQIDTMEFSNCVFQDMDYCPLSYAAVPKFDTTTFKDMQNILVFRGGNMPATYVNNRNANTPRKLTQNFICSFEGCTFDGNQNGFAAFRRPYKNPVRIKNCTFQNASYGIYSDYSAIIYLQGTQTFNSISTQNFGYGYSAVINNAYDLDLTVTSDGVTPVEDAVVSVRQKEGNESFVFTTNASGKITDNFGDNPCFTYSQLWNYGNTTDIWSDGTGDQIHVISIYHPDYGTFTQEVAFTEDKTITATLVLASGETTIYDSTLYDCTLY